MTHWIKTREKSWIDKECCFLHSVCFTPTPSSFPSFTSPSFSLSFSLSQQSRSVPLIILLFLSSLRLTLADKYSSFSRQQRDWIWFSLLVWMKLLTTANTEWVLVVIWHKHCLHPYICGTFTVDPDWLNLKLRLSTTEELSNLMLD